MKYLSHIVNRIKKILRWLRDLLLALRHCWPVLIILLVAYSLSSNDQLKDVIRNLDNFTTIEILLANTFLFLWSYSTWYTCRVIYYLTEVRVWHSIALQKWIPRILGILPSLIFFLAINANASGITLDKLLFFISLPLYVIFVIYRRNVNEAIKKKWGLRLFRPIPIINHQISLSRLKKLTPVALSLPAIIFVTLVFAFFISNYTIPVFLGPLGVVFSAMLCWTGLYMYLIILEKRLRFPFLALSFLLIYVSSFFNNNHKIRIYDKIPSIYKGPDLELGTHFKNWLEIRSQDSIQTKVILVAAEGGGIRSAYWTGIVLSNIQDKIPAFSEHIYTMSTVSGGTLGVTTFVGLLYNQGKGHPIKFAELCDRYLRMDYLSPLLSGFFYTNMSQWYIPFRVPPWDRARYLEYSWERGWDESFEDSLINIFRLPFFTTLSQNNYLPALFYNGTHVETGKPVITSSISWNKSWEVPDIIGIINKDVTFSTATLLTARFPVVTPPGMIDPEFGHVADGGYFENSGLNTVFKIYSDINKSDSTSFLILSIKSGSQKKAEDLGAFYEVKAPLQAFYNAWDYRTNDEVNNFKALLSRQQKDTLIEINLPRNQVAGETDGLPLGWYLSESSADSMKMHAKQITDKLIPVINDFIH